MKITETSIQSANQRGIRELQLMAQEIPGVINLARDQSDFDPPEFIREAVAKALDDGHAGNLPARGFKYLREAIAAKLKAENDIDADPDNEVLLTADTTQVLFSVCRHLIDSGDEVIMIDPGFNYDAHIQLFGGKTVRVPAYESNGFDVDPEDIRLSINDKTKLVIINTPANPTSAVFDKTLLREIAKIARERDLWVLSDEAFEDLIFDENQHTSIGSLDGMKDRTISVYSLSSSYAMPGWEVGYIVAPQTVIDELAKMGEHMGCRVSAVAQHAALAAINYRRDFAHKMMNEYEKRRAIVHQRLNTIEEVSCPLPASTFYAFPNFTKLGLTSWNLARYMVREHKVALLPGSIFGSNGEGFLRLTFAIDPARLKEAMSRIKEGVGQLLYC
jgi:aspartate/methionine/tyrosine aminotransferase